MHDVPMLVTRFKDALVDMDLEGAKRLLTNPDGTLFLLSDAEAVIVPALESIGKAWEAGQLALSQVYMSGRQCESIMDSFPPPPALGRGTARRLAIAVLEDYHFLGMRLVASALRVGGFELEVYGRQEVSGLAKCAKADGIEILLVSVLMLRSALLVRELRTALDAEACHAKLVVGGAPFRLDPRLWREVGADATADTSAGAVAVVRGLLGGL